MPKNQNVGVGTAPTTQSYNTQSNSPSKPSVGVGTNKVGVGTNKVGVGSSPTTQSYNTQSKK
jgi:hypothetical protein